MAACYTKALLRSRPLYGMVGYTLWNTLNKKVNLSANSGVSLSQIYKTDLAIASRRLGFLDLAIERQRANADIYSRTLSLDPLMLCSEKRGAHYNRYLYPITFESSEQRNRMATYLLRHKIDTMQYLDDVVDVATKQYGYNGGCPTSERLSKRVLVVPNYHSLKKREIHRIAQCINEGWMETESHG
jgi:dTDP-4-amino-4,6-dideoxygalactose transaminase